MNQPKRLSARAFFALAALGFALAALTGCGGGTGLNRSMPRYDAPPAPQWSLERHVADTLRAQAARAEAHRKEVDAGLRCACGR